jgi:cephalosporin-C deacetylase-like acetyl esterase
MSPNLSNRKHTLYPPQLPAKRTVSVLVFATFLTVSSLSSQEGPQDPVLDSMDKIAQQQLQKRAETIGEIHTVAQAEQRKQVVRAELLNNLGGLPDYTGPLNARTTGQIRNDAYTIEKVIYESLPGFYVTANIYRPNLRGRYPAVLLQAGHTQEGKPEDQRIAANLAMKGFVVLCFDPIGQGERSQTYSEQFGAPLAGWSTPEHIQMGAQAQLIGEGLARYFIWDAKRSLDYLASRPDVDASRMGAAGCSGGGALTTFIGALDPRLKVVIPACYPSTFQSLFRTLGPDAEMIIPHFLASSLDTADFVELSAPTPWLIEATEQDQFHFSREGVRLTYEEARKWYSIYGAQDSVGFLVGPGWHGMPLVSREAVYEWMIRWLKNGQGDFHEQPMTMYTNHELQVTASGNVESEAGSRKLYQLLLADFHAKEHHETIPELLTELRNLKIPTDGSAPVVHALDESTGGEVRQEHIKFESDPGIWLEATVYVPPSPGRKPAVLMVKGSDYDGGDDLRGRPGGDRFHLVAPDTMAEQLAKQGQVVLEMKPRDSLMKHHAGPFIGNWENAQQANLIGLNFPALRAHDILRGVDLLTSRPDVDAGSIRAAGRGVEGTWLLLAAAADPRIVKIWLYKTPYSLRAALESSMTADLWEALIPNFVLHWDYSDLVKAMGERQVLWTDPINWMRRTVDLGAPFQYRYVLGDSTDLASEQDEAYIRDLLH